MSAIQPNLPHVRCTVKIVAVCLGANFMLQGQPAHAQPSEINLLRQQLAQMQARLDKLEAAQSAAQAESKAALKAAAPSVSTASKSPLTFSGLLQVHSLNFLSETTKNGGLPSRDTFRLRRGEIRLTAPAITDRISATVMFDPAKVVASRGNSATSTIRERDNLLQEIQISYLISKGTKGSNFIDVGQYKIPVGYESTLVSSGAMPLIERSLIFSQRDPFDGGYGDVRDTGIQLRGTTPDFDYRIGVFNGLGDRQNGLSLSDNKALLGLVAYKGIKNLTMGISGGQGNTGVNNFTVTNGVTSTIVSRDHRSLFNVFGFYKKEKLSLQGEYLVGKAAPILVESNTIAGRDIRGYYGTFSYLLTPKIEGVLRFDHLNTNTNAADADANDFIMGLNYYIKGNNAKVQTNLIKRNGGGNAPTSNVPSNNLRNDRLELRTAFQVAF